MPREPLPLRTRAAIYLSSGLLALAALIEAVIAAAAWRAGNTKGWLIAASFVVIFSWFSAWVHRDLRR